MKKLYDVQRAHAKILYGALGKHNAALDASSTGTGKTVVAAELAVQLARPTLVVGLKQTLDMWERELKERKCKPLGVINYEMLRTGKTKWGKFEGRKIWQFTLPKDTLIIWDEVQKCQGVSSLNSKMLVGAKPFTNLMLSATAVESPADMRALGYILGLHKLWDYWKWSKARGCYINQWGGLTFGGADKELATLHTEIFPERGARMTVADLKEHFQDTQIITTPLSFGNELKKIYEEMEDEIAELEEVMTTDSKHPAAEMLVAQLRARQRVELLKVPTILEMATDLTKEGRSVAIFVNFDDTIEAMKDRFDGEVAIIRGGQSRKTRTENEAAFQSNTARVVICNVQAGGVSINLHDTRGGHPRTAIISPSWNAKDIVQTLGRVHRAGGKTPSQQHVLFAAATVEAQVAKVVRQKINRISLFNDGGTE